MRAAHMKYLFAILLSMAFSLGYANEANDILRVEKTIHAYFSDVDQSQISYAELKGGLSDAKNYKIRIGKESYVLRLQYENFSPTTLSEWIPIAKAAGEAGIGPKILWVSPNYKEVLTECLPNATLSYEEAQLPDTAVKMAETLKKLHGLNKRKAPHKPFMQDIIYAYDYLHFYGENTPELDAAMDEARLLHEELVRRKDPHTTVHGDLNARNIFLSIDGIKLIDWEGVMHEDPFYDLAYFSLDNGLTEANEQLFLKQYLGGCVSADQQHHFEITKRITLIGFAVFLKCVALQWSEEKGITLDRNVPLKDWTWFLQQYTIPDVVITPQFYFDSGKSALKRWEETSIAFSANI